MSTSLPRFTALAVAPSTCPTRRKSMARTGISLGWGERPREPPFECERRLAGTLAPPNSLEAALRDLFKTFAPPFFTFTAMTDFTALPRTFYRPSAERVADQLLGHYLLRSTGEGLCGGVIVETEAYLVGDPACHGAPGPTKRNRVMFGPPGHAYVYLIYGFHFCVNAVCCPPGTAEAVLIRAIEPTFGEALMQPRRKTALSHALTSGPGKLCQALDITRVLDGADLCNVRSALFIAENPNVAELRAKLGPIVTTSRIGITKAADLPLRFYLDGSAFVSRRKQRKHLAAGRVP